MKKSFKNDFFFNRFFNVLIKLQRTNFNIFDLYFDQIFFDQFGTLIRVFIKLCIILKSKPKDKKPKIKSKPKDKKPKIKSKPKSKKPKIKSKPKK